MVGSIQGKSEKSIREVGKRVKEGGRLGNSTIHEDVMEVLLQGDCEMCKGKIGGGVR